MSGPPVHSPARFTPVYGLGFALPSGAIEVASQQSPLPVSIRAAESQTPPAAGSTSASQLIGPFAPEAGIPVTVVLAGDWQGTVQLSRSTDGGSTRHPLTAAGNPWGRFFANACEQVWEESDPAATLFLETDLTGGTLHYRVGH